MTNITRTYMRRDSAVAALKKAGIAREEYPLYIAKADNDFLLLQAENGSFLEWGSQMEDGVVTARTEPNGVQALVEQARARNAANSERLKSGTKVSASNRLADEDEPTPKRKAPKAEPAKLAPAPVQKAAPTASGETISAVMRSMILKGATNQEVWDHCQPLFNIPDSRRGYPAWYRTELKRKGLLPRQGGAA